MTFTSLSNESCGDKVLTIGFVILKRRCGMDERPNSDGEELMPRELEVLRLMAQGLTNPAIAARLGIARSTVGTHVHHILQKLGAHSRMEAVMCALRRGLIDKS
ncbi:MAG: hypothetical protein C4294_18055 [Nitrospiraceae bacterium]